MIAVDSPRTRFGRRSLTRQVLLSASAAGACFWLSGAVRAQSPPPAADQAGGDGVQGSAVQEVEVTATRVDRSGYTAPTPTTIVGSGLIDQHAADSVGEVLDEVPEIRNTISPTIGGGNNSVYAGQYLIDLRGLGVSRTLVLVDGQRFVPQFVAGHDTYGIDVSLIPTILVQQMQIVTGGASAQWGSDAVGGVVNIVLKKNYEGFAFDGSYGASGYGDSREPRLAMLAGTSLLGGKLHLEGAVDATQNSGVGSPYTRSWGQAGWGFLTQTTCKSGAAVSTTCPQGGQPAALIVPNTEYSVETTGGLINSGPLKGLYFNPGGTWSTFNYGAYPGTELMSGGDPINNGENLDTTPWLESADSRIDSYMRLQYDITDTTHAYLEGSFGYSHGWTETLPPRNESGTLLPSGGVTGTALVITRDNAYLPSGIGTLMDSDGLNEFTMGRVSPDIGITQGNATNGAGRVVFGLEGKLAGDWSWNAALIYGHNRDIQTVYNDALVNRIQYASDAVELANGQIVCGATIPGRVDPYTGKPYTAAQVYAATHDGYGNATPCIPANFFGAGSVSSAAAGYMKGNNWAVTNYAQTAADANLTGNPFETWAGPVSVAVGAEWRGESLATSVDPLAAESQYLNNNNQPVGGNIHDTEGYLETVIPVLHDMPLAKELDLNGAIRETNYSTSGNVLTWKIGGTYDTPVSGLMLRSTDSVDIRAPNIFELYSPATSTTTNATIPGTICDSTGNCKGPIGTQPVQQLSAGNADLQPEKARTLSYGFAWAPEFAPGLQASLDYYDIVLRGEIAQLALQNILNYCAIGTPAQKAYYCQFITYSPTSISVYNVNTSYVNVSVDERSGFDFATSYHMPVPSVLKSVPANLRLDVSGTYIDHYKTLADPNSGAFIENAGVLSGSPKLLFNTSATYEAGPSSVGIEARFVGPARLSTTYCDAQDVGTITGCTTQTINTNHVGAVVYVNLYASYDLGKSFQLYGTINNLFDRDPPFTVTSAFAFSPTTPNFYDVIGRAFKLGVRYYWE